MKISLDRQLGYSEVDAALQLKPVSLFGLFQEAAIAHTEQVGLRTQDLLRQGFAWMMYKIAVRVYERPALDQALQLRTWSTGIKGYRAHREFEILTDCRTVVSASSIWFAVDLQAGRIRRIPEDMAMTYTVEPPSTGHVELKGWKPEAFPDRARSEAIEIRPSDFDPYGHVNNAAYLDFLDTALERQGRYLGQASDILIMYRQGIQDQFRQIDVETAEVSGRTLFRLSRSGTVFAEGQLGFETGAS